MAPATPLDLATLIVLAGLSIIAGAAVIVVVLIAWGLLAGRTRARR